MMFLLFFCAVDQVFYKLMDQCLAVRHLVYVGGFYGAHDVKGQCKHLIRIAGHWQSPRMAWQSPALWPPGH